MDILDETPRSEQRIPEIGNRLAMMVLDHIIFTAAMAVVLLPVWFVFVYNIIKDGGPNPETGAQALFGGIQIIMLLYIFVMAVYLNKDALNGRSPAKRILGARVINQATGETAGPMRCLLRNITIIFWPIEALLAMLTADRRRLGDYLAGTRVVMQAPDNPPPALNWGNILLSYLAGACVIAALVLPFYFFTSALVNRASEMHSFEQFDDGENTEPDAVFDGMESTLTELLSQDLSDYCTEMEVSTTEQATDNYVVEVTATALNDDLLNDEQQLTNMLNLARKSLENSLPEASLPVKGRFFLHSADPDSKDMRILSF